MGGGQLLQQAPRSTVWGKAGRLAGRWETWVLPWVRSSMWDPTTPREVPKVVPLIQAGPRVPT